MSDEVLIHAEGISKKFCRSLKRSLFYGIQDIGGEILGRNGSHRGLRKDEFWAVDNVSFELRRGECLGLIGRNGAGKTTLLKMLNGLIKPDRGSISIMGRVGSLIALGAGFNPILTGRENIYVNGSVLGMTKKEIDGKIGEIIDFADIKEFIDAPVQNYSSGMQVRLGFSVATAIEPDVLLLDEVLAVGDAAFRNKCYNRIGKLKGKSTVVFVSHSSEQVAQICDIVLVLEKGKLVHLGDVAEGVRKYSNTLGFDDPEIESFESIEDPVVSAEFQWGTKSIGYGGYLRLNCRIVASAPMKNGTVRIPIYDAQGIVVAEWNSKRSGEKYSLKKGKNILRIVLGPLFLRTGRYTTAFVLNDSTELNLPIWSFKKFSFRINGPMQGQAPYQLPRSSFV